MSMLHGAALYGEAKRSIVRVGRRVGAAKAARGWLGLAGDAYNQVATATARLSLPAMLKPQVAVRPYVAEWRAARALRSPGREPPARAARA